MQDSLRKLIREMIQEELDQCECSMSEDEELDEVTPPGKEKVVKALKKQKGVDNPWAVAWSQYNKEH